jgi:hypothetical protein
MERLPNLQNTSWREFHISRPSRNDYQVDGLLFALSGNVLLANFGAARQLAQKMNEKRDLVQFPETSIKAAHINAMGLLDEVLHFVVARYREERNPQALQSALSWLDSHMGALAVDNALLRFTEEFPPLAVHQGEMTPLEYSKGETGGVPNRQVALEELLMLWLSNQNPALEPLRELFDDAPLSSTAYKPLTQSLRAFFDTQPTFGPDEQNLIDLLRAPALAHPDSITAQLEYILGRWGKLAPAFLGRLLSGLDFIREDEKASFSGPGPSIVPIYDASSSTRSGGAGVGLDEPERFSQDREWMPRAVLMAKNAYVWRDQLSKKYGRSIRTLDQVPDEELDALAAQGFTGLWLIGLWERSVASQKIKQMCGNEDAVASAYSLHDYVIAHDLGGPDAMHNLSVRAGSRGLRMASDMVPNHMAIDSRWVMEHPDWFLSLDHPPFPTYTFNGVDLSNDERVGIFLEDHYYSKSDAAVVFKRVDKWSGSTRYIYHGNDGTSMAWNDTAQLNYLRQDVREAVIQTILHVARQFPIIRFDAAMTLAKRHYQRLWFPEPGTGGAIPSRAEYGLNADSFNETFPEEFWREVVDRVATEVPDTLLLAEAFWMMEGYFVRTLGMHRVYNSAFMNMMRDEENLKYRLVLKNTLEFDPDILKRYVNFMNNPDEETAVEQFGKGGKYFGVCTLMATLPGLPMFGHGQIEGFAEKYGMEYQRAYWDETPDADLMARHEREIFPLMRRRYLFAEVENFLLYDFWTGEGGVNEDVFAYSNRSGDERSLVIFHNKYAEAAGWIHTSVGSARKHDGGQKHIEQKTLGDGLGLHHESEQFTIFRDNVSGLEYIRSSAELCEKGLYVELGAYESHVFLDFREVEDTPNGDYAKLAASLNGRGVPNIGTALRELALQPVHAPFKKLIDAKTLRLLIKVPDARTTLKTKVVGKTTVVSLAPSLDETEADVRSLVRAIRLHHGAMMELASEGQKSEDIVAQAVRANIEAVQKLSKLTKGKAASYLQSQLTEANRGALFSWAIVKELGRATVAAPAVSTAPTTVAAKVENATSGDSAAPIEYSNGAQQSRAAIDELMLGGPVEQTLSDLGATPSDAARAVEAMKLLTTLGDQLPVKTEAELRDLTADLFRDEEARRFLGANRYDDVWYFNRESFEQLLWWLFAANASSLSNTPDEDSASLSTLHASIPTLQKQAQACGYQVEPFVDDLKA